MSPPAARPDPAGSPDDRSPEAIDSKTYRTVRHARANWLVTVDAIRQPLMVHDAEHRVLRANRAYAEAAGMDFSEILGRPYWECFPRTGGPLTGCLAGRSTAEPGDGEETLVLGDRVIVSCTHPLPGDDAAASACMHLFDDVTDRTRAEEASRARLRRGMAQAEALASVAASTALAAGDLDGLVREVTEHAARVSGVERVNVWLFDEDETTLRCIDLYEATPGRHTSGSLRREEEFADEFRALKTSPYVNADEALTDPRTAGYRESYLRPLGITSMLDAVVQVSDRHLGVLCLEHVGKPHHWEDDEITFACRLADQLALAIVNSERQQALRETQERERRFRALLENASDLLVLVDPRGKITYVSPSIERLGGYTPEEVLGRDYLDFAHPADVQAATERFAAILAGDGEPILSQVRFRSKSGDWRALESVARNALSDPTIGGVVINARDITERLRAERLLRESEERYRSIFERAKDLIYIIGPRGELTALSPAFRGITGWDPERWLGHHFQELIHPGDRGRARQIFRQTIQEGISSTFEMRIAHASGDYWIGEFNVTPLDLEGKRVLFGIGRDVTDRRRSEVQLRLFRTLIDHAPVKLEIVDPETLRFVDGNEAAWKSLGYTREEFLSLTVPDVDGNATPEFLAAVAEELQSVGSAAFETLHRRKDGTLFPVEVAIRRVELDRPYAVVAGRDVTVRRRMEAELREREEILRTVTASAQDAIIMITDEGSILVWNAAAERLFGYTREEVAGKELHSLLVPARHLEQARRGLEGFRKTGTGPAIGRMRELTALRRDGTEFPIELSLSTVRLKDRWHSVGIVRDITERKRGEEALRRASRALRTLSAGNEALVRAVAEPELLDEMCRVIVDVGQYRTALVAYVSENPGPEIEVKAACGRLASLRGARYSLHPEGSFCEAAGAADDEPEQVGSALVVPLREVGQQPFGLLYIGTGEAESFDPGEISLLEELAEDVAYGVVTLRTRGLRREAESRLRRSLEQAIAAIAATVEARDPYTAGHQRRVARLAAAIAVELGLSDEAVEGIRFGSLIHDLGKIRVPAEILAKPTRLHPFEYELVKSHTEAGFEILRNIEFPWPVARMVLEHHERMDGSGYPRGLTGTDILLEARIIAVADVVEAMASHRPYRPGLGVDAALREIETRRGQWFDEQAVDACLRLFRSGGFAFDA